eukprot:CAMPEP_0196805590 /NCGR_PEP_ID=MMETSP1362-20130617/5381_1 /TAXON_ID=163516 /ORGANISM="Leptocylindrus danicus, Strain CCMP1856" /LENGTH=735 /DNA_ID=CAMNT_0042178607 /DNA_START=268 /DNA_END=2475 /DNA_ORIENTATION=+
MSFQEMDETRKHLNEKQSNSKRAQSRKRKQQMKETFSNINDAYDRRTGRWTPEEMAYVDELIRTFEQGKLPLVNGMKLNDFLAGMLQCKQSRLTKKMKNARLSSRSYVRTSGHLDTEAMAKEFSKLEEAFFRSIACDFVRAEVRFHMQKEWRELFSNYCVHADQPLNADDWLSSVEELERRVSIAKDSARLQRRKLMMKYALNQDSQNPDQGVFIDRSAGRLDISAHIVEDSSSAHNHHRAHPPSSVTASSNNVGQRANATSSLSSQHARNFSFGNNSHGPETEEFLSLLSDSSIFGDAASTSDNLQPSSTSTSKVSSHNGIHDHGSLFLSKVKSYIVRSNAPFEHVDLWVPSYVTPNDEQTQQAHPSSGSISEDQKCRLCFAGADTVELSTEREEEHQNLVAFGDYSEKFSFDVGCGLPGRVYQSGIPTWEQSVQNAPFHHFERCGGAAQWGINTVVGVPIPSPNVGRVVLVLYSIHDRSKDHALVSRLCEEFAHYMPSPKWKLVVECGHRNFSRSSRSNSSSDTISKPHEKKPGEKKGNAEEKTSDEIVFLLGEHMPSDATSPSASYLAGFMSLRLMLLRSTRSSQEDEWVRILVGSYQSYRSSARSGKDIAMLLARDCMFLMGTPVIANSNAAGHAHAHGGSNGCNENNNNEQLQQHVGNQNGSAVAANGGSHRGIMHHQQQQHSDAFEPPLLDIADNSNSNVMAPEHNCENSGGASNGTSIESSTAGKVHV